MSTRHRLTRRLEVEPGFLQGVLMLLYHTTIYLRRVKNSSYVKAAYVHGTKRNSRNFSRTPEDFYAGKGTDYMKMVITQ